MSDRKAPADDWGLDPYTSAEITHTPGGTMSIDEAREMTREERDLLVAMRGMMHSGGWDDTPLKCVILAIEALIDAKLSPAPVGAPRWDGNPFTAPFVGTPTPPAKDTGEDYKMLTSSELISRLERRDARIASLEAQLAAVTAERDRAMRACEQIADNARKRIEALETGLRSVRIDVGFLCPEAEDCQPLVSAIDALLSPPASEGDKDG